MQYYDAIIIRFTGDDGSVHNIFVDGGNINLWGIERSGFFNDRGKWAKGFENQRV